MISKQITRRPLTRGEHFLGGHQSMPDRAKYTLYVQQTCLDVQGSLCTVTPKGKPCTRFSARARSTLSRAESTLYVQSTCLDLQTLFCTCKEPLARSSFEKFNLLIYWFQKSGITYPTLEMIKIYPKSRLFNDKSDVFWMGLGFKIWRCDISSLEPVPHKQIGSTNTPITCSRIAWTCKESFASQNLDKCNVLIYWFQ